MNKHEIKETLNKKYNRDDWKILTKNIFKNVEYFKVPKKISTTNDKILDFLQIGNLNLNDGKTISLFELRLTKNLNIYKNKIELRNIVTKYIDQYSSHGVLVVFDNQGTDYRLTFSSKYSEFDDEGNIIDVETSPKRYTYLLGENESCSTASERFLNLYNQKNNLKIEDVLSAFSVDKITEDFFNTYKNLYYELYDEIEILIKKDKYINNTFKKNSISIEEFAKKLLGQIVFLYFLQKKGWLGLKKNKDDIFNKWGNGDKNFIRNLFNEKYTNYKNFFNDILEPLFAGLSVELPENYYAKLDIKIPFLNGGLFDPIKNYDWLDTKINISNDLIKKILDNFENYNFTIQEEDPDEKEVAIDPEMLGKVFENLLEIKDKKSKGTFYTPRKIAKYICEEVVLNYFINIFGQKNLNFIQNFVKDKDDIITTKFVKNNFSQIDESIKKIKICDPAIGSGEFPVEIMNLLINLRLRLNKYFSDNKRTSYLMKRFFIKNSIYGIDIEDSAIETAKLRLWLSLIIDEEDYDKVLPLPNLDYKIFKGNSLLKIDTSSLFDDYNSKEIIKLKNDYFNTSNISQKKILKKQIDNKFKEIFGENKDSFDIKIFFEEVFNENGGFDIVIGNPPYVALQKIKDDKLKKIYKNNYKVFTGNTDLYCLFIELGSSILSKQGSLGFITSNKWIKTGYGKTLREYVLDNTEIIKLIDLKSLKIFKKADVDTSIIFFKKGNSSNLKFVNIDESKFNENVEYSFSNVTNIDLDKLYDPWVLAGDKELDLFWKIKNKNNLIDIDRAAFRYGIKTGLNDVFLISEEKKNELINLDSKNSKIIKPCLRGTDILNYTFNKAVDYLIYIPWHFPLNTKNIVGASLEAEKKFKSDFRILYDYMMQFKELLKKRNKSETGKVYEWYCLQRAASSYYEDFDKSKVVWMNLNRGWKFSYVPKGYLLDNTLSFVGNNTFSKFLTGIFSSSLHMWYFKNIGTMFDDGGFMCKVDTISQFPLVKPTKIQKEKIEKYVDVLSGNFDLKVQKKLNQLVMDIYNLNNQEKDIINSIT
jgi:hypothetical protein